MNTTNAEAVDTRAVSPENFAAAMALLGVESDNPDRALTSVLIEQGRITSTYVEIQHISPPSDQ